SALPNCATSRLPRSLAERFNPSAGRRWLSRPGRPGRAGYLVLTGLPKITSTHGLDPERRRRSGP
ncbi:MAG: hypothetical protein ACRDT8_16580, partial [Micromonosporaceae bacterium]